MSLWIRLAVVTVVAVGFYLRTWDFGVVYVDDDQLIADAQSQLAAPSSFTHTFTRAYFREGDRDHAYYRPVATASYVLDAWLSGANARGYHRTNALLHATAVVLVLLWLRSRGCREDTAMLGALIFAMHPALAEAVAWVPGRPDLLVTVFGLLAWILHSPASKKPGIGRSFCHGTAWLLALLSKEAALVLPIVWCLEGRWLYGNPWKRSVELPKVLAWVVAGGVYVFARMLALEGSTGTAGVGSVAVTMTSLWSNLPTLISSLGKLALPVQLSVLATPEDTWLWPGLFTVALLVFAWARLPDARKHVKLTLAAFTLVVLPSLPASTYLVMETRLYLPLIPVLGLSCQFIDRTVLRKSHVWFGALVLATAFAWRTYNYMGAFTDRETFTLAAVEQSPHSALAHRNRGVALHLKKETDAAIAEYEAALKLNPAEPVAHNNLGVIFMSRGQLQEAERELRAELGHNPNYSEAHHNLAMVLLATGRGEEAAPHWEASLARNPNDTKAMQALAAYYLTRDTAKAVQFGKMLHDHPAHK